MAIITKYSKVMFEYNKHARIKRLRLSEMYMLGQKKALFHH